MSDLLKILTYIITSITAPHFRLLKILTYVITSITAPHVRLAEDLDLHYH
jgi:hypothetical protein